MGFLAKKRKALVKRYRNLSNAPSRRILAILVAIVGALVLGEALTHGIFFDSAPNTLADELGWTLPSSALHAMRQRRLQEPVREGDPSKQAFVTLCVGDNAVQGALVLFHSLKRVGTTRQFAVMMRNVSEANVARVRHFGVKVYENTPLEVPLLSSLEGMEERDKKLMSKLKVWLLTDFEKVVQMDSDMIALRNLDELFQMPEISACAMADKDEKIIFYERAGTNLSDYVLIHDEADKVPDHLKGSTRLLPGWSGLNSGIVVLEPSEKTFEDLIDYIRQFPRRVCCPSQELVYNFFERKNRFFRLPTTYNLRRLGSLEDTHQIKLFEAHGKVYHFVEGIKPWGYPPEDRAGPVGEWWRLSGQVDAELIRAGLGIVEADNKVVRRV